MFIPFGDDFKPDAPFAKGGVSNTGTTSTHGPRNVITIGPDLYQAFLEYAAITTANGLGGSAIGMFSFRASNGTYYTFGAYSTVIKLVNGTDWTDVSRTSGGAYATAAGDRWNFVAFGDRVIGVNYTDATQTYLAGTDTDFAALAGTPPKAKYVTISGDFVVLGYVNDGTVYPHRVQWSAQGDPTASWASSATTQADYDDLDSNNGAITGLMGFAEGFYVFQERAITRYDYVGSPLVFAANESVPGIGCYIPSSICKANESTFFIAKDGVKKLTGGVIVPVGIGRVDRAMLNLINGSGVKYALTVFHDPNYPVVHFAVLFTGSNLQYYLFSYNYITDKWCFVAISESPVVADTMINMGVIYSTAYPGGVIAGFDNTNKKLGSFTGTAYSVTFLTSYFPAAKNGGKGTVSRFQVVSEIVEPSSAALREFTGQVPGSSSNVTTTAVGTNCQYTAHTPSRIGFQISATFDTWAPSYKALGVNILEMSEDIGR